MVLEKTLEYPLVYKEIQPGNPKGNQLCIFIGTTDAEAEAPLLWPSHTKSLIVGRSLGKGNGNPLECSCLENSMDRGAWRGRVHRVAKSGT